MANIEGPGVWHLHVVGAMPPGIDPALMDANVQTSIAIALNLSAWVRGFWVEITDETPDQVKARAEKAQASLKLIRQ